MTQLVIEYRTYAETDGTIDMEPTDVFGQLVKVEGDVRTVLEVAVGPKSAVRSVLRRAKLDNLWMVR